MTSWRSVHEPGASLLTGSIGGVVLAAVFVVAVVLQLKWHVPAWVFKSIYLEAES